MTESRLTVDIYIHGESFCLVIVYNNKGRERVVKVGEGGLDL